MPSSSQPSASSSPNLKRKQPSISTFFTKRTPAAGQQPSETTGAKQREDKKGQETSDKPKGKAVNGGDISDEDEDDIVAPAPKRLRANGAQSEGAERSSTTPPPAQAERTPHVSSSQRTEQFKFTSSPAGAGPEETEDKQETKQRQKQREKLRHQFVRKLAGPDCLIGIGKPTANDILTATEDAAEGDDDEEPAAAPTKGKAKKGGSKLTPMEKQVIEIKRKHMNTVLVVEVGYKFRFFGEDARIAAKELGIVCIPGKFRFDERTYWFNQVCLLRAMLMENDLLSRSLGSAPRSVCIG